MKASPLIIICMIFFMVGCRSSESDNQTEEEKTALAPEAPEPFETDAIWDFQYDTLTEQSHLIKSSTYQTDSLDTEDIIAILNRTWPGIHLEYVRTSQDTMFVRIPESVMLTQQMGTTGAQQYLTAATYSLTELPDVAYIFFEFEEGDHAVPGVYHRHSWDQ